MSCRYTSPRDLILKGFVTRPLVIPCIILRTLVAVKPAFNSDFLASKLSCYVIFTKNDQ